VDGALKSIYCCFARQNRIDKIVPYIASTTRLGKKELTFSIIAIFLGILSGLVLAECIARVVGVRPVVLDANMFEPNSDPLLPYRLRPGYQGYFAGGAVTIEPTGRRHIPFQSQMAHSQLQGGNRILLLGDSGVFGLGLDDKDTIASRLKALMMSNHTDAEVDAIGVPGYTSWNEYVALQQYDKIDDTRVVLLVYMANDLTYDNDTLKMRDGQIDIVGHSLFHFVTRWLYSNIYISNVIFNEFKKWSQHTNMDTPAYYNVDGNLLRYSMQAIEEIKKLCDQKNIAFLVGIYRDVIIYQHFEVEKNYEKAIMQALSARGISSFILKEHTDKLPLERAKVAWNDPHPSPEAAELLANQIYTVLESKRLLGKREPAD